MDTTEESIKRFYVDLGTRIRMARRREKMSQLELADTVELTRSSIANIEAGRQRPLVHMIVLIARAINEPVDRLLPASEELDGWSEIQIPDEAWKQPQEFQDFVSNVVQKATGRIDE